MGSFGGSGLTFFPLNIWPSLSCLGEYSLKTMPV